MTRARNSANLASHGNLFVDITNDRTGIGSVVPGQSLHVAGTAGFHGDTTFTGDLYNATWDRSDNTLKFVENAKLKFGDQFSIYKSSSHAIIDHEFQSGSYLRIGSANGIILGSPLSHNQTLMRGYVNGASELYYAGAKKLETTTYGTNTTGTAVNDGLVVAGVATVTTMNVTGVLTYDDVTSVDSIGIVTARQGIHIDDSIVHIGDTNTKIRFPSADRIALETGGSEKVGVANTGVYVNDEFTISGSNGIPLRITGNLGTGDNVYIQNNTSGGHVQFGFRTNDTDGNHHRAFITAERGSGMSANGKLELLARGGTGTHGGFIIDRGVGIQASLDLIPQTDSAYDLGTSSLRWDNIYADDIDVTGSGTFDDINVGNNIVHVGDTDTSIDFTDNKISFKTGGTTRVSTGSTGTVFTDSVTISGNHQFIREGALGSYEQTTIWNQTSGGYIQIGLRQTDSDGPHHRGFLKASKGTGNVTGKFELLARGPGGGTNRGWIIDAGLGIQANLAVIPETDSTYDLGLTGTRWRNVYADTYYGNGANITDLNGSNIASGTIPVARIGTGTKNTSTFYRGDGTFATVTPPAITAISNPTNNRIVTSEGGTTVNAEPNLTFDGNTLDISAGSGDQKLIIRGTNPYIRWKEGSTDKAFMQWHSDGYLRIKNQEDSSVLRIRDNLQFSTDDSTFNSIWYAGNDGSGSGLDADTLDGVQASGFVAVGGDTMTGALRIDKNSTVDGIVGEAYNTYFGLKHSDQTYNSEYMILSKDFDTFVSATSGYTVRIRSGGNDSTNELIIGAGNDALTWRGNKVFHAGNDGAGSGLDADTLDGISSGSFLRSDADDETTARITFKNNHTDNEDDIATSTSFLGGLEVYNQGSGNDAFMAFHAGSDFACYFGLDADSNSLSVGGWSMGANKYKIWHSGNDGAGSGLDADTLDGLSPSANASNNTIVQRNGNGYVFANYFNTTANDTGTASDVTRFYCSEDQYIRYIDKASMRSVMNVTAVSGAFGGRETQTSDTNYWVGSMGWGSQNFDTTVWDYGSGFIDVWSNPSGQPSGTSHWQAIQSMHYTNQAGRYGFRIACGAGNPAYAYIQGRWNTTTYGWHKLWNAANDGSGSGLDADTCDGVHGTSFLRSDANDTLTKGGMTTYSGGWNDWLVRFQNTNSTNDYVYMCHHNYGMHIRNDNSGTGHYLLDVYGATGNRFQIRGSDARTTLTGSYMLQTGLIHFDVKLTSGTSSGDIKFNSVLENVGSHYSTSTGRFTAPVAGVYHFAGTLLQTNSGGQFDVNLRYNGSSGTKGNSMRATFTGHSTIQISETLKMNANDYVHINVSSGSLHHDSGGAWCGFQGTLLG